MITISAIQEAITTLPSPKDWHDANGYNKSFWVEVIESKHLEIQSTPMLNKSFETALEPFMVKMVFKLQKIATINGTVYEWALIT